jgi:hypothetical protein
MSSIEHQLTTLYVFVDDFLTARPTLSHWRRSPHDVPSFADAEVLTIALLQGCLGVASLKQTYRLVAHNHRSAFPCLCSYPQWVARLQALAAQISALLVATAQLPAPYPAFYLIDAKPWPVCHRLRHGRVRLLREDGAYWGKTSKGWFFGFKLHILRHIEGRIVNLILTPGNWDDRAPVLALLEGVDGGVTLGDWAIADGNERKNGPKKPRCWSLPEPMYRSRNSYWLRYGKPSKPHFRSSGIDLSTVFSHAPGMGCGTPSSSRSFTTTSAKPGSFPSDQINTDQINTGINTG